MKIVFEIETINATRSTELQLRFVWVSRVCMSVHSHCVHRRWLLNAHHHCRHHCRRRRRPSPMSEENCAFWIFSSFLFNSCILKASTRLSISIKMGTTYLQLHGNCLATGLSVYNDKVRLLLRLLPFLSDQRLYTHRLEMNYSSSLAFRQRPTANQRNKWIYYQNHVNYCAK